MRAAPRNDDDPGRPAMRHRLASRVRASSLGIAVAVGVLAAAAVLGYPGLAQQVPGTALSAQPPEQAQPAPVPPGLHWFQIKDMTPAEHEAFMQVRAKELAAQPAQPVPPLPEQRIEPVVRGQR